ncbi:hypothetical protein B0J11DRAFT_545392 [Dendryphion nanum]|uniref:Uncharacterized protein n=1 Tax=Dendryphion nanum TaxID=256645 RepID=A0A9P9CY16_9PLEO|nr:hypothetical protein B0J11DRAFT_545392 [Dendryphion nanum]
MARSRIQLLAAAAILTLTIGFLFSQIGGTAKTWSFRHQSAEEGSGYPYVKPSPLPWHPPRPNHVPSNSSTPAHAPPPPPPESDRIVVLTTLENEDLSWLSNSFSSWQNATFILPSSFARLHANGHRTDKGRIVNAYLTYIIENYYTLPSTIVFLNLIPNDEGSSFNPMVSPSLDRQKALKDLSIPYIQKEGFANLRCIARSTCTHTILPFRTPSDEFRTLEVAMPYAWKELFKNDQVPEQLGTPCCGEFAVSKGQVQKRGVEEYVRFWEWLNRTSMDDDTAGKVLEFLWHVIFGREAVYCPEAGDCECKVYGRCS